MWIEGSRLQEIDTALESGRAGEIDRLLAEILQASPQGRSTPSSCAVCRHELIRSELRPGLTAFTCPAAHGAWLDPESLASVRRQERAGADAAAGRRRVIALSAVLGLAVAALVATAPLHRSPLIPRWVWARAMPAAERTYLQDLMTVLNDGITNRRNIEGVLQTASEPDTYRAVYAIYNERARNVIGRLNALAVPPRLQPVHARIVNAAERQIVFYREFTDARIRDHAVDLSRMLGHPALRESDYDLHAAWNLIRGTYPDLDGATLKSIEDHLCQFDAV
jgi:hypothetical protein